MKKDSLSSRRSGNPSRISSQTRAKRPPSLKKFKEEMSDAEELFNFPDDDQDDSAAKNLANASATISSHVARISAQSGVQERNAQGETSPNRQSGCADRPSPTNEQLPLFSSYQNLHSKVKSND